MKAQETFYVDVQQVGAVYNGQPEVLYRLRRDMRLSSTPLR